jgi:hypothetical protein
MLTKAFIFACNNYNFQSLCTVTQTLKNGIRTSFIMSPVLSCFSYEGFLSKHLYLDQALGVTKLRVHIFSVYMYICLRTLRRSMFVQKHFTAEPPAPEVPTFEPSVVGK